MARTVQVTDDAVVARLTGWTAIAALRKEVRAPLRALGSISTERDGPTGFRLAGTSVPWTGVRAGRFRRDGLRSFLSFDDRDRVPTLELDRTVPGAGSDVVAVGVPPRPAQWKCTLSGAIRRTTRSDVIAVSS